MRIAEMLTAIANWLESSDNEAILLAEYNEDCLEIVAKSCVNAASLLKNAAEEVDSIEPQEEDRIAFDPEVEPDYELVEKITDQIMESIQSNDWYKAGKLFGEGDKSLNNTRMDAVEAIRVLPYFSKRIDFPQVPLEKWVDFGLGYCDAWNLSSEETKKEIEVINSFIDTIMSRKNRKKSNASSIENVLRKVSNLASLLDNSNDEELKKQASVIDELLLTIAAPPDVLAKKQAADDEKINELKKKYNETKENLNNKNKIADTKEAIEKSNYTKDYRILEAPLSTRYCPDHPGAQISRIEDNVWQCELDKKIYNFETGYDLSNGNHVSGGSVSNQNNTLDDNTYVNFNTRDTRLNSSK